MILMSQNALPSKTDRGYDFATAIAQRWVASAIKRYAPEGRQLPDAGPVVRRRGAPEPAADRFKRGFRDTACERVTGFLLSECYDADRTFDYRAIRRREASIWKVVTEQPQHLLDPQYESWRDLLLAAIDATIERPTRQGSDDIDTHTWTEYNVVADRHPPSAATRSARRSPDAPPPARHQVSSG